MKFSNPGGEVYIPDHVRVAEADALARTTHLGIGAHQDDLEIMAHHGILECYQRPDKWFLGVTVTDGGGSARTGPYAHVTDEQMQKIRKIEQQKAAHVGDFSAVIFLNHPSSVVKDPRRTEVVDELKAVLAASRPEIVYTHNLCDKHDTHIGVVLRVLAAIRALPAAERPKKLYGCEVWKDLDWMPDEEKVVFDVSERENMGNALVALFDSQIAGGKRYDLATPGRRRANATYSTSHATDKSQAAIYAMDLTPLIADSSLDPLQFAVSAVGRFQAEVHARVSKMKG